MSSIESSANSSGCSESNMHANIKNQWVMDDFGGALQAALYVAPAPLILVGGSGAEKRPFCWKNSRPSAVP
jgi:hypothetical protein